MANTPNLNLPLIDENATADVPRDMNALAQAVDTNVKAAIDGVKVPDATLTQKGIAQLSSATDSTSEAMAATPKAVKAAYDRGSAGVSAAAAAQAKADAAIPKAIPDTRSVPTKPSDYSKSVAYSFKSGAAVGLPAEQYVVIHGFKGWNDDSGGVTHEYASGGTTGAMYHRTGTSDNDTWSPWMKIIDNGAPWQQRKLTENNGLSINISNGNANNLTAAGFYVGENVANAPTTGPGAWWYIEVQAMSSGSWVVQIARDLFAQSGSYRTRIMYNGAWGPWSDDLFQSVANGKTNIASAISGKGVPASGSDTFATLAAKIGQISTGIKMAKFDNPSMSGTIGNLAFTPKIVVFKVHFGAMNVNVSVDSDNYLLGFNVDGNLVLTDNYAVGRYSGASGASGSVSFDTNGLVFGQNYINYSLHSSNQTTDRNVISVYIFGV
ncbi:pyocin knob domain-containing protein [Paenibacillus sp. FSL M7-1455]|uniref:pyocin knob domain-containing protein n=1 Tax=Paenibacillus sp. FSL M7-1455 TaxID=2975316 RepID=UPI0030F6D3C9